MAKYNFDASRATHECIDWIKDYFVSNGDEKTIAVIGISGGKDSTVVAGLCAAALGPERVLGVKLPQGSQKDIDCANAIIEYLGIQSMELNIGKLCGDFYKLMGKTFPEETELSKQVTSNLPARVRMTMLYAIAAQFHGRVANTCNYSEDYIHYSTKYGDLAGDFAPINRLTSNEVIGVGANLCLPSDLLWKTPEDGLSGLSDEENFGFSYEVLNAFLREGKMPDSIDTLYRIRRMHRLGCHKDTIKLPCYSPTPSVLFSNNQN